MRVIRGNDINDVYCKFTEQFNKDIESYETRGSRAGGIYDLGGPIALVYEGENRGHALMVPERKYNPVLHLIEPLWILAGRDDVDALSWIVPRMREYSDDGKTFHGAYGKRIIKNSQLINVCNLLAETPDTRRAVLAIYQPDIDTTYRGKDLPCNVAVTFYRRREKLDMVVFNRSNDMVWGALGTNYTQFQYLLEYVAWMCGAEVGTYTHISSAPHVYVETADRLQLPQKPALKRIDPIRINHGKFPDKSRWHADMRDFWDWYDSIRNRRTSLIPAPEFDNRIFTTASIMLRVLKIKKDFGKEAGLNEIRMAMKCTGFTRSEWLIAMREWLK